MNVAFLRETPRDDDMALVFSYVHQRDLFGTQLLLEDRLYIHCSQILLVFLGKVMHALDGVDTLAFMEKGNCEAPLVCIKLEQLIKYLIAATVY